MKILLTAALLFSPIFGFAKTSFPSSTIPERREFPLNPNFSPCEDFHQYVCSKAEASFKLRPDRSRHLFAFSDSRERILEAQMKFMKELPKRKNLSERTAQVRDNYLACMNAKSRAQDERDQLGIVRSQIEKLTNAAEVWGWNHNELKNGLGGLTFLWPENNYDNPQVVDATLYSSLMALPDHKYYEQTDVMKDYADNLHAFIKIAYPGLKKEERQKRVTALIELEKDFVKVFPVRSVRQQRWSEKRVHTQKELLEKYPNLRLEVLFAALPEKTLISVPVPEALDFLNKEIHIRPLTVWKDLSLLRSISNHLDDAYPAYFKVRFEFNRKYFGGPTARPSRQERCTTETKEIFSKEIDAELVDQLFPQFDESKVVEVAERVRASILKGLENNTWLSKEGKKEALAKIKLARLQLVKPHNDKEWDFLPVRQYSSTKAVSNLRLYREARWEKSQKEFREPANLDAWGMSPLTVNAYYSASENKFVLPIGILQYPFYDKAGSIIENLGAVGAVIGHELGHSVDDSGSRYDSEGRLRQWMTIKDLAEFNKRGQKMIDQFNNAGHDGKLTLGENVADLVGLTFAYKAAFPDGLGSEKERKDFFVAYGRLWCEVIRPDNAKLLRKTDSHASGKARINEQVKHQSAFAETFQCKPGDKMTLPLNERVQIW